MQAVSDVLNVAIHINESIEGWAPLTVISPISGQQGTTVINIGHLDKRTVLEISGRPVVRDDQKVYRATNL